MALLNVNPVVTSVSKSGSTALNSDITLSGGASITLTQSGQDISIANTGVTSLFVPDSSLTISAGTGNVVININLSNANHWVGNQQFESILWSSGAVFMDNGNNLYANGSAAKFMDSSGDFYWSDSSLTPTKMTDRSDPTYLKFYAGNELNVVANGGSHGDINLDHALNFAGGYTTSNGTSFFTDGTYFTMYRGQTGAWGTGNSTQFAMGDGLNGPAMTFYDYYNGGTFQVGGSRSYGGYNGGTIRADATGVGLWDAASISFGDTSTINLQVASSAISIRNGTTDKAVISNNGIFTKYNSVTTVAAGAPSIVAQVNSTGNGAAIAATTIYPVPAAGAGMYRISWMATITRAATTSSVLGGTNGFQVVFTDVNDSVVKTSVAGLTVTSAANTTATMICGHLEAYCKASTNLQYKFDYTSVGGTTMQYDLSIRVEALL